MTKSSSKKHFGARTRTVDLASRFNWPRRVPDTIFWRDLAEHVRGYPAAEQRSWGVPFRMAAGTGPRVILAAKGRREVDVRLTGRADYFCFLHAWHQIPETLNTKDPTEGLVVGEYELRYADGSKHTHPIRARFEVAMVESPGPPWLAVSFFMPASADPLGPTIDIAWSKHQVGIDPRGDGIPAPLHCVLENPHPQKLLRSLTIRGLQKSPLIVAALTLYEGSDSPLRHLPRRTYRVRGAGKAGKIEGADVDLGTVTRTYHTDGPRGKRWLDSPYAGLYAEEPGEGEDLVQLAAAQDATLSVDMKGRRTPLRFSVGEAFHGGKSGSRNTTLEVLGQRRQWMQVTVIDASTNNPTPVRVHLSGPHGEYLAPYGHHEQINPNWFEDYGADVLVGGRQYAYVPGQFTTDMPVGDIYAEIYKGFEYEPVRVKATIRPGQKELKLRIRRWQDLRSKGWITSDTHVHFISPHTAWLEGQAEGVNVVDLLASQWGRLFTNVGDITGGPNVVGKDTIVFVGTENRNHMLGHMSMLGTKNLPVYPMCDGGISESWIGDPEFRMMAEWALENRRKGGLVIRPHFPYCGNTEDPVAILNGLVDALELWHMHGDQYPVQEWYRYLNCGYRVACCNGTDKMSAASAIGWRRTYAKIDPDRPFNYGAYVRAVRAGRTFATTGPLLEFEVDGRQLGDAIEMSGNGGTLEFRAQAACFAPLGKLEIVLNGRVVASVSGRGGQKRLTLRDRVKVRRSGWIAARCTGNPRHPGAYMAAHTSPVYITCGDHRPFDGPAAQHMLALVEGGTEYLNKLATVFDESSRKRMVKLFNEARNELTGRLVIEGEHHHHHGSGPYHTHGH